MKLAAIILLLSLILSSAIAQPTGADHELEAALATFRRLQAPKPLVAEVIATRANERARHTERAANPELYPLHYWDTGDGEKSLITVSEAPNQFAPAKRAALIELESDYHDMENNIRRHLRGSYYAPADRQKLLALRKEHLRDLAELLSPNQLEDYQLWVSPLANRMRNDLWLFVPTEDEFRKIHRLRTAFYERFLEFHEFNVSLGADLEAYTKARDQLSADIFSALGSIRYADYERAESNDFQSIFRTLRAAELDTAATWHIYELRDFISAESNRLYEMKSQSAAWRHERMKELADFVDMETKRLAGKSADEILPLVKVWSAPLREGYAVKFPSPNRMTTRLLATGRSPPRP